MTIRCLPAEISDRVGFGHSAVTGIYTNCGICTRAIPHTPALFVLFNAIQHRAE